MKDEWRNTHKERWIYIEMDRQTERPKGRWTEKQTDVLQEGRLRDGQREGQMV